MKLDTEQTQDFTSLGALQYTQENIKFTKIMKCETIVNDYKFLKSVYFNIL